MSASTSKPAIFTLSVVTSPEYLRMMAHSSAWTEALLPSPSRLRQRGSRSAASTAPSHSSGGCGAAAPLPCPVACQPGLQQLGQGGSSARPRACAHRQCPPKFPARGLKPTRQDPQSAGHRGPHRHQPSRQRRLARAIADAAWAEFGRQLSYKAAWLGAELVVCDRWFPSSKTCSRCGRLKEHMTLAERVLRCDGCGLVIDRDRNAAANLAAWAERHHAQAPDRQAGGRESTPLEGKALAIAPSDGETSPSERGTNTPSLAGVEDIRGGWRPSSSPMLFDAL
jgi:hypothetical protein